MLLLAELELLLLFKLWMLLLGVLPAHVAVRGLSTAGHWWRRVISVLWSCVRCQPAAVELIRSLLLKLLLVLLRGS